MDIDMDIFAFTSDGIEVEGTEAIFPICEQMPDGEIKYLGTGFFITNNGIFVTAKHVIEGTKNPFILQLRQNNDYYIRGIHAADLTHRGDLAVGVLKEMTNSTGEILANKRMLLSSYVPQITEVVSTYAFPETRTERNVINGELGNTLELIARQYNGIVAKVEMGGIERISPSPVILCTIDSLPGNSGGPVFSRSSKSGVVGINTSGMTGVYHVVSLIDEIRELKVDNARLTKEDKPRTFTVNEMIKLGFIGSVKD